MFIKENNVVLFQGDSITDAGRDYDTDDMGRGYAAMIAARFGALYPEMNVKFINRGINGHRTTDLLARWKKDCIEIAPDILSVLIGINDCWRRYDSNLVMSAEEYEQNYRMLLSQVKERLPKTKIIMIEPFLLPCPPDRLAWREDLDPKIQVARTLGREFADVYIPADGIFAADAVKRPPEFWAADGVHPTQCGAALLAESWLKAVGIN